MEPTNRWQIDDNNHPYFDGDLHEAKAKDTLQVVTAYEMRPVAAEMERELLKFIEDELAFRGSIQQLAAKVARGHLGQDRPLNDDDREYYELCDLIVAYIRRMMIRGIKQGLDSGLLRR
jgi:hypothetical protein